MGDFSYLWYYIQYVSFHDEQTDGDDSAHYIVWELLLCTVHTYTHNLCIVMSLDIPYIPVMLS